MIMTVSGVASKYQDMIEPQSESVHNMDWFHPPDTRRGDHPDVFRDLGRETLRKILSVPGAPFALEYKNS
jgi:hypothetical protein